MVNQFEGLAETNPLMLRMRQAGYRCDYKPYLRNHGQTTCAWLLSPPIGQPAGSVLFIHGGGADAFYPHMSIFSSLLNCGFEIFTFDLDGHGRASDTMLASDTIRTAVPTAIREARRWVQHPLHIVGYSLGGVLALDTLIHDQTIASAIIISAPVTIDIRTRHLIAEGLLSARLSILEQVPRYGLINILPGLGGLNRAAHPIRTDPQRSADTKGFYPQFAKIIDELDLPNRVDKVRCPTLLIYGTMDCIVPLQQGQALYASIPGSQMIRLHECHGSILFSKNLNREVTRWLKRSQA